MRPTTDALPAEVAAALGLDASQQALNAAAADPVDAAEEARLNKEKRPRKWECRMVKQKTLCGEMLVRKWVSDEKPAFAASCTSSGDSQPQQCAT